LPGSDTQLTHQPSLHLPQPCLTLASCSYAYCPCPCSGTSFCSGTSCCCALPCTCSGCCSTRRLRVGLPGPAWRCQLAPDTTFPRHRRCSACWQQLLGSRLQKMAAVLAAPAGSAAGSAAVGGHCAPPLLQAHLHSLLQLPPHGAHQLAVGRSLQGSHTHHEHLDSTAGSASAGGALLVASNIQSTCCLRLRWRHAGGTLGVQGSNTTRHLLCDTFMHVSHFALAATCACAVTVQSPAHHLTSRQHDSIIQD
jgi:hypothetical protein